MDAGGGTGDIVHLAHPFKIGFTVDARHDAGVHVGIVQGQHGGYFENDVGHVVDGVMSLSGHAAHDDHRGRGAP